MTIKSSLNLCLPGHFIQTASCRCYQWWANSNLKRLCIPSCNCAICSPRNSGSKWQLCWNHRLETRVFQLQCVKRLQQKVSDPGWEKRLMWLRIICKKSVVRKVFFYLVFFLFLQLFVQTYLFFIASQWFEVV